MPAKDVADEGREELDCWREQATENAFDSDPFFRRLLHSHLGPRWAEADGLLRAVADQAGPRPDAFVREGEPDDAALTRLRQGIEPR